MERLNDSQSKREDEPGVEVSGSESTTLYHLLGHEGGGHSVCAQDAGYWEYREQAKDSTLFCIIRPHTELWVKFSVPCFDQRNWER